MRNLTAKLLVSSLKVLHVGETFLDECDWETLPDYRIIRITRDEEWNTILTFGSNKNKLTGKINVHYNEVQRHLMDISYSIIETAGASFYTFSKAGYPGFFFKILEKKTPKGETTLQRLERDAAEVRAKHERMIADKNK
ncbi:hypothetical protein D3C78_301850 [compost metagenome]